MHWLAHWLGMDNGSGPIYLAWSGWGGDLSSLAIFGALMRLYRHNNCHVHGCWRIGRHPVEGTPYVTCAKHHPDGAPTHERVLAAHLARKAPKLRRPAT